MTHRDLPPNETVDLEKDASDEKVLEIRCRDWGGIMSRSAARRSRSDSLSNSAYDSVEISDSAD